MRAAVNCRLESRCFGRILIPVTAVVVLIATVVAIYLNRPLIAEQRASTNAYQAARAAEAASGGLTWALAHLNAPSATAGACGAYALRRRALEDVASPAPWKAACELTAQGLLACGCEVQGHGDVNRLGAGFQVTVSRVVGVSQSTDRAMWDVSVTGCSTPAGRDSSACAAADGATLSTLDARLRFVPLLGHFPDVVFTAGGAIAVPPPFEAGEPAWGGYVMGAYLSPPSQEPAVEPVPRSPEVARTVSPRDQVPAVDLATLREAAYRLQCEGECSGQVHRAVHSGHAVIWVDGDLSLTSALTLGDDGQPVLLWVTGDVTLGPQVSVIGMLLARSVVWRAAAAGGTSHFKGAMVADGSITVTGSPSIEWAPQVLNRLAATSGWFEPVAGWSRVN